MSGSKIYKLSTSSPIPNLVMFFTERILGEEYLGKVGDYIQSIQTGKTPPMNVPKYYSSNDIGWAKPSDIGKGKYLVDLPDKLSKVAVDENKVTIYQPGTLLIICIGAGVGRVALTDEVVSSNQQITGILFDKKVIPEYAYYYFFCREAVFKQNASQTTLPIINQKGLKDLDFRCPDRKLQKTFLNYLHYCEECLINEKLPIEEGYELPDVLFETAKKFFVSYYAQNNVLKELDQQQTFLQLLRQTILQEAVQGKLTKQDPTDEPATELLKRIKAEKVRLKVNGQEKLIKARKLKKEKELPPITEDEIPFELPEGWSCCRLEDIASVGTGATPLTSNKNYYAGDIPWITSSATGSLFVNEAEKCISEKAIKETNCKVYPVGTLIVAMYGQGKTRGQITELLIEAATNQACAAIELIVKDENHKNYIKYFFQKIYLEIRELAEGGAQPNLNLQKIKDTLIPLPPLAEQQRIVAKVQQLQQQLSQLEAQVQQSRQYAQLLLQSVLKEAFEQKGKVYEMEEESVSMVAEE